MTAPNTPASGALPAEEAGYTLLSELAGIDTHDVSLRDHSEAWEALERYDAALASREASQLPSDATAADFGTWLLGTALGQVITEFDMGRWWQAYCAECVAPAVAALASPQIAPAQITDAQIMQAEGAAFSALSDHERNNICVSGGYIVSVARKVLALAAPAPVALTPIGYAVERSAFRVSPHGQDAESREWMEFTEDPKEKGAFLVYAGPVKVAPTPVQPAGTVRFDIPAKDCFVWDGAAQYPMVTCMDCRATEYGITKIEHLPGCRVAAALATLPSEPEGESA